MSVLIQLLLPRNCVENAPLPPKFQVVRDELASKFGGVTVYSQATAEGLWKSQAGIVERDYVVLFEVMADKLQKRWWRNYRRDLENRFDQIEIVIRAQQIVLL